MDEEQGLASPLAGSIRGIRRSVSSNVFTGRSVLPQQPDPQTTSLLTQNSLTLTTVSQQLQNISLNLSTLNFSLSSIKDNLALSDSLDRQREAAQRNRERILAEQGLREGKESDIEKKIQFALQTPVRRIAATTQGVLQRLVDFFLILAGGWLTNTLIDMINANADGNVDLLKKLQRKLATGLLVIGGTLTAITFGLSKVLQLTALLASRAIRFGFNNILKRPFVTIINLLKTRLGRVFALGVSRAGGSIGSTIASLPLIGGVYLFLNDQFKKLASRFGAKPFGVEGGQVGPQPPPSTGRLGGVLGPFRKIFGGVRSTLAFGTLFDIFVNGENPLDAIKNNLGGVLIAAISAPFIIALVGKLAIPALAAGVIKFIATSIFFGIGKSLFNRFRFFGGNQQQVQQPDTEEIPLVQSRSETISFGGQNLSDTAPLVAQTTNDADSIVPVNNKKEMNVADNISNFEEGGTTIVNIPSGESAQTEPTQLASAGGPEEPTSKLPFIGFDNDNIHTQYAVTTFGAFA